jgi:hypothetical protein
MVKLSALFYEIPFFIDDYFVRKNEIIIMKWLKILHKNFVVKKIN